MPRYGLAAALVHSKKTPQVLFSESELFALAEDVLKAAMNHFMLAPHGTSPAGLVFYKYLPAKDVNPGSKSGQVASKGYFVGPHITTSNNAAGIVKEVLNILKLLKNGQNKTYELKRSFAPMISKINAGKATMSNPRVDLLHAAFTAIASITEWKPAAYQNGNTGLIPDLPFYDSQSNGYPLYDFISLFRKMQAEGLGEEATHAKFDEKRYHRPPVFRGNYPNAPKTIGLGIVPLIASVGNWVQKHNKLHDEANAALQWMQNRPIYSVSDAETYQESFGHHLIKLALTGELYNIVLNLNRVSLIGLEDGKKFSDNKWKLFLRFFEHFLKFFNLPALQNFLSFRATYPFEFFILLKSYFMHTEKYDEALINSAVAYGKSLNKAASYAGHMEVEDDRKKGRSGRTLKEYKHRVLLELESIVQSAKTGAELIARLNTQVGRLTMWDIPEDAQAFLIAVTNDQISLEDAKNLITAFMRLNTYEGKSSTTEEVDEETLPADESVLDN